MINMIDFAKRGAMEQERDAYRDEATEWKERYQQLIQDILQQLHK
jgi:hypothetical protein